MALNFESIPKEKATAPTLEAGKYPATVKEAKMANGKSGAYLQVILQVTNPAGDTSLIFDNFFNSDKPLPLYKIGQFLRSINCILQGDFELQDLPKIIVGKKLQVALKVEQNEGYAPRNVVDAFDDDIYLPVAGSAISQSDESPLPATDDDCPFTMGGDEY